jgi:hypothetical protein
MSNKYVVKYFLGKLPYGKIKTSEIHVEANNEEQAIELAKMQLKYGQKIRNPRIFSIELDK